MITFGTVCIYCVIIANLLQAAILTRHWIWIHVAAMGIRSVFASPIYPVGFSSPLCFMLPRPCLHPSSLLAPYSPIASFSFFGLLIFSFVYNSLLLETPLVPDPYWVMQRTAGDGRFWLTIILAPSLAILPRFLTMCGRLPCLPRSHVPVSVFLPFPHCIVIVVRFYHRWWTPTLSQFQRQKDIWRERKEHPLPCWLGCCRPL